MVRGSYPIAAGGVGPIDLPVAPCTIRSVHRPASLLPRIPAPLKALVAQSAALQQPRDRTTMLACWMVARLALPRVPRESDIIDPEALLLRADATRRWLTEYQPLPAPVFEAAQRACDVAGAREPALLADALETLRDLTDAILNNASRAELTNLAQLLRRSSLAAMR